MPYCQGTRNGHNCASHLYRCRNCGKVGCLHNQAGTCTNQGFAAGKCLTCGKSGTREGVH
jgi:hypothetical protein